MIRSVRRALDRLQRFMSVVNVSQLVTLDRSILLAKVKALPGATMDKVDAGLKLVLSI